MDIIEAQYATSFGFPSNNVFIRGNVFREAQNVAATASRQSKRNHNTF
jgi:hypothetical protein